MFVSCVYIRFFRSFNFDYLRKAHEDFHPDPWDTLGSDGLQFPFVKVPLQESVTTIVGANESGKSQLLTAIKRGLTGEGIARGDFCRYSQFFVVNKTMKFPDFGLGFKGLDETDRDLLAKACKGKFNEAVGAFNMFRFSSGEPVFFVQQDGQWAKYPVKDKKALDALLPDWFEIAAHVALPESVPVKYLAEPTRSLRTTSRRGRQSFFNTLLDQADSWFGTAEQVTKAAPSLVNAYAAANQNTTEHDKQLALADDLLLKVAKIERVAFQELLAAVDEGRDGFANGLVEQMNRALASSLNFPRWWSQDHQFQLLVTLRDQDLVFTIKDRTGTEYSADERSSGLKYFLSYFIQYLAHEPPVSGAREVLLMDEPDAYLSSSGQQDLLKIFEDFAYPESPDRKPCQVVYVTHSPFLIDKNHGERICVLEKGEGDEGTRVVRNAARNHYEPLRSAFGSFVGETTFIGTCNLMLEGMSDQILIAGMSARLRHHKTPNSQNLDLNSLTLVPTGSAPHIPYMVYLALGRDVDRPAVTVLLDSDKSGNDAYAALRRGPKGKPLLDMSLVLQVGGLPPRDVLSTRPGGAVAIEDLIPLDIGVAAVKQYAADFLAPAEEKKIRALKVGDLLFGGEEGTHEALEQAAARIVSGIHLDKVGFARSVIDVIKNEDVVLSSALAQLDANFRVLFRELGQRQRKALRLITTEKTSAKLKRLKRSFLLDHPSGATKETAKLFFEEIDAVLDGSVDADDLRIQLRAITRAHELEDNPTDLIGDYSVFCNALETLAYREVNQVQEV